MRQKLLLINVSNQTLGYTEPDVPEGGSFSERRGSGLSLDTIMDHFFDE